MLHWHQSLMLASLWRFENCNQDSRILVLILAVRVLRKSSSAILMSPPEIAVFRSSFFAVFTAGSAFPLAWLWHGLLVQCSKSRCSENVANSEDVYCKVPL